MSPFRSQAIMWTNAGLLSIGPMRTYFSEIWTKSAIIFIEANAFENVVRKMSSILSQPARPGRSEWNASPFQNKQRSEKLMTVTGYPGYFWESHWKSIWLPEISRVTLTVLIPVTSKQKFSAAPIVPVKVTLAVSGNPLESQWASRKYPG